MLDREGIPLSVIHLAANVHDSKVLQEAVDAIELSADLGAGHANAPKSSMLIRLMTSLDAARL